MERMSDIERKFAEENHNLVYSFLHSNKYNIEDFYSIAVMGYLKAVQAYIKDGNIKENYSFSCIAWLYMKSEIKDYFKAESRQKRTTENIISLDAVADEDGKQFEIVGIGTIEQDQIDYEFITEIFMNLSDVQKAILQMRISGYSNTDICRIKKIASSSFYAEMKKIKKVAKNILN